MKRLLFLIGLLPSRVFAASLDQWGASNPGVAGMWQKIRGTLYTQQDPVAALTGATVNFVFPLIGSAAVLLVIYAAIKIIASQGKEDAISDAKKIIMDALIGVILGLLATSVVLFFAQEFFPALFQ